MDRKENSRREEGEKGGGKDGWGERFPSCVQERLGGWCANGVMVYRRRKLLGRNEAHAGGKIMIVWRETDLWFTWKFSL